MNDALGRRTSVVYDGNAFARLAHDDWGYNARSELVNSMRYDNPTPGDPNQPDAALHRSYSYDPIGNRTISTRGTDPAVYYCANELNQYETLDGAATCPPTTPDESFTHDADGNLTQDGEFAYAWDAENRLIRVEPAGSPVSGDKKLEFSYDYMGRRIEKKVFTHNGSSWGTPVVKRFIYYNWLCLVEYDVDGGGDLDTAKKFTWGLDLAGLNGGAGESTPIEGAAGIGGLLATRDVGQSKNYVHFYDGNGNVTQLIDRSDGSIDAAYEYDAYGNITAQAGVYADENAYRFSTRVLDPESGKYAYPYRIYDPERGRWLSGDPIGEGGGINRYAYNRNIPIATYDALGLAPAVTWFVDIQHSQTNPLSLDAVLRVRVLDSCCYCDSIAWVQLVKETRVGPFFASPLFSGTGSWSLDGTSSGSPFYIRDYKSEPPAAVLAGCLVGGEMRDSPGAGSSPSWWRAFTQDFESCAVCTKNSCPTRTCVLGCVKWGHLYSKPLHVKLNEQYPVAPSPAMMSHLWNTFGSRISASCQ